MKKASSVLRSSLTFSHISISDLCYFGVDMTMINNNILIATGIHSAISLAVIFTGVYL